MAQTTSPVGRAQLEHPDLGFDTDDGGVALHTALTTLWTKVSDHLPSRWTGEINLEDSATVNVTHTFGLGLSKLKLLFFVGGNQLTQAEADANFLVSEVDTNEIEIQNISGGPLTFSVLVLAFRYGLVDSDTDPSFSPVWSVEGDQGNRNFFSNGDFVVSAPSTFQDVVVLGNLTLDANLTVQGNLYVSGQIISNGFKFDCFGDVTAVGGIAMQGSDLSMTIGRSLISGAAITIKNSSSSQPTLVVRRDLICIDSSGTKQNVSLHGEAPSGNVACPGYNLVVGGKIVCGNLSLAGGVSGTENGGDGGNLTVGSDVVCGDLSTAGSAASGPGQSGGNAGNITVTGNLLSSGSISLTGGNAGGDGSDVAGNGGNLSVSGDVRCATSLSTRCGAQASSTGAVGTCGTITVKGSLIAPTAVVSTAGQDSSSTSSKTDGGSITVDGNVTVYKIDVSGGDSNAGATGGGDTGEVTIGGTLSVLYDGDNAFAAIAGDENATLIGAKGGDVSPISIGGDWFSRGQVHIKGGDLALNTQEGVAGSGRALGSDPIVVVRGNVRWVKTAGSNPSAHKINGGSFLATTGIQDVPDYPTGNSPGLTVHGHCEIQGRLDITYGLCAQGQSPNNLSSVPYGAQGPVQFLSGCDIDELVVDKTRFPDPVKALQAQVDMASDAPNYFGGECKIRRFVDINPDGTAGSGISPAPDIRCKVPPNKIGRITCYETTGNWFTQGESDQDALTNKIHRASQGVDFRGPGCVCVGLQNGDGDTVWTNDSMQVGTWSTAFAFNGTGGGTSATVNFFFVKKGRMVTMFPASNQVPTATTGTSSTQFQSTQVLPQWVWPKLVSFTPIQIPLPAIADGGTVPGGILEITLSRQLRLLKDVSLSAWTNNTASSGFRGTLRAVSWMTDN